MADFIGIITQFLGFKNYGDEYKVMGLAPYSKQEYYKETLNIFRKFQKVEGVYFVDKNKPKDLYFAIKELIDNKRFDAIAGALQTYTEELICKWISNCVQKTGVEDVCMAGGVSLNVKSNYLISKLKNVRSIHVPPSPDDSSQSMGAVYASYSNHLFKNKKLKKIKHFYYLVFLIIFYDNINKKIINLNLNKYFITNKIIETVKEKTGARK